MLDANEQSWQPSNQVHETGGSFRKFMRMQFSGGFEGGRSKLGGISPLYGKCRTSLRERDPFSMSLAAPSGQTQGVP